MGVGLQTRGKAHLKVRNYETMNSYGGLTCPSRTERILSEERLSPVLFLGMRELSEWATLRPAQPTLRSPTAALL